MRSVVALSLLGHSDLCSLFSLPDPPPSLPNLSFIIPFTQVRASVNRFSFTAAPTPVAPDTTIRWTDRHWTVSVCYFIYLPFTSLYCFTIYTLHNAIFPSSCILLLSSLSCCTQRDSSFYHTQLAGCVVIVQVSVPVYRYTKRARVTLRPLPLPPRRPPSLSSLIVRLTNINRYNQEGATQPIVDLTQQQSLLFPSPPIAAGSGFTSDSSFYPQSTSNYPAFDTRQRLPSQCVFNPFYFLIARTSPLSKIWYHY